MDKEEDVGKQIEDIKVRLETSPETITWDDLRLVVRQMTKNTIALFDDAINSFWTWGKQKVNLQIFQALVKMHGTLSEDLLTVSEHVDAIRETVLVLSGKLEKSEEMTAELEDSLNSLKSKFKEPTIKRIVDFLDTIDERIAKGNKAREEYTV